MHEERIKKEKFYQFFYYFSIFFVYLSAGLIIVSDFITNSSFFEIYKYFYLHNKIDKTNYLIISHYDICFTVYIFLSMYFLYKIFLLRVSQQKNKIFKKYFNVFFLLYFINSNFLFFYGH